MLPGGFFLSTGRVIRSAMQPGGQCLGAAPTALTASNKNVAWAASSARCIADDAVAEPRPSGRATRRANASSSGSLRTFGAGPHRSPAVSAAELAYAANAAASDQPWRGSFTIAYRIPLKIDPGKTNGVYLSIVTRLRTCCRFKSDNGWSVEKLWASPMIKIPEQAMRHDESTSTHRLADRSTAPKESQRRACS